MNQTLGQRLNKQDLDAQRQARRSRQKNNLIIWIMFLLIGIGLGYGWRMHQTSKLEKTIKTSEISERIRWQGLNAFEPIAVINSIQGGEK